MDTDCRHPFGQCSFASELEQLAKLRAELADAEAESAALSRQRIKLRAENERLRATLETIRTWDMIHPSPAKHLADGPWLKNLVCDALRAQSEGTKE